MSRRARLQFPGAVYHVMTRGTRKLPIFEDDCDRRRFIETLAKAARRYELLIFAVCLMGNHYHLVFETPRGNLSAAMQYINGVYARALNRRHGRTGHVFEARFRSLLVQRERYLLRVVRYVVRNPVRAGLTPDAESWAWSTYRATAGLRPAPEWLHLDWLEWAFDATTRSDAQAQYRVFVNHRSAAKSRIDTMATAIGSPRFKEFAEAEASNRDRPLPLVCRPLVRPPLEEVLAVPDVTGEHAEAMRVAHEVHRYTMAEIAQHLRLDRSTVGKAIVRLARRTSTASLVSID